MADDIPALIDHLGVSSRTFEAAPPLFTAVNIPTRSASSSWLRSTSGPDAIYAEMRAQQGQVSAAVAEFMKDTPMYQLHQLAILPGLTHYDIFASPLFAAVTLDFLDGQQKQG